MKPLSAPETTAMKYGVRMTLPEGDPMRAPHLLGPNWESVRWFASEAEREAFIRAMTGKFDYYRIGDKPSLVVERIEQPE
ncbi:MAG TPA: hypothetical protein VNN09_12785 [Candidatus Competibacteraceae bacterium]|nr:hypothetical protein [Candidatus Competibacteraceae bacterium]